VKVGAVLGDVAVLVGLPVGKIVASRVQAIHGELRVMPIDDGMVEAEAEALVAEGVHQRVEDVALGRSVGGLVVGQRRVPQAEAVVVLAGGDDVLHAGVLCFLRPNGRIVEVGVKVIEVLLVVLVGDSLVVLDPLVAGGDGVDSPVDEQPEAIVGKPGSIGSGGRGGHNAASYAGL